MFGLNFKFELKSLLRSAWIQTITVLLVVLCLFATYNGAQKVQQRQAGIAQAQGESDSTYKAMVGVLDSVERGLIKDLSPWLNPQTPSFIGNRHPRLLVKTAQPMELIATGQSDLFAHTTKTTLYGENALLNFSELSSPVQLLFGSFDLAFVFVYLLPLIVIAFAYNLLSREREQGSLRLVLSQPIQLLTWLLQKASIRFSIIASVILVGFFLALGLNGLNIGANFGNILLLAFLTLVYTAFWFLLAVWVNLAGNSSANNAVTLLAIWVGLVLLVPSMVNQMANNLYPVPSRALLVNEVRAINAEVEKQADTILASYYRNHPELMPDSSKQETYIFYKQYYAAQELIQQKIKPLVATYDQRLAQQQNWVNNFRFASPAILLNEGFQELAGTSNRHFQSFRAQVLVFAQEWRDYFKPKIFKGAPMDQAALAELPQFVYQSSAVKAQNGINLLILLAYLGVLFLAIRARFSRHAIYVQP